MGAEPHTSHSTPVHMLAAPPVSLPPLTFVSYLQQPPNLARGTEGVGKGVAESVLPSPQLRGAGPPPEADGEGVGKGEVD
jgi:hypothetical protein